MTPQGKIIVNAHHVFVFMQGYTILEFFSSLDDKGSALLPQKLLYVIQGCLDARIFIEILVRILV